VSRKEGRVHRLARIGVTAVVALGVATPALASGGSTVIARFKWSVAGSMKHTWSITSTDPCGPVGGGLVRATFTGTGRGAFKVERNAYGTGYNYDPQMNLRGKVTEIDNTTQNPPEFEGDVCRPTDKSGCGTRKLKDGFGYLEDVSGVGKPLEFVGTDFGNAFSVGDCEHGGFGDFGRINAYYLPKLYPGVPPPKKLAQRRKRSP
jgi:hypothetical protein